MDTLEKLMALRDACILQQAQYTNSQIDVGDFTYGQPIVHIWDETTKLKIGKFCSIGGNVQILLGGEHHHEWITTYPFDVLLDGMTAKSKGDVEIGNDVWIGDDAMILSGVRIGDGAVIGAGSVVTKDVKDYTIVGGAPAKFIRYRAAAHNVKWWHDIRWWDWPIEKIAAARLILSSGDVDALTAFSRRWDDELH